MPPTKKIILGVVVFCFLLLGLKLLLMPRSIIEWDEALFSTAVYEYDVSKHQPHPPGFPVWIALGKATRFFFPHVYADRILVFWGLLFSAFIPIPLFLAASEITGSTRIGAASAVMFPFVPACFFWGSSAMTTTPSLFFALFFLYGLWKRRHGEWWQALASVSLAISIGIRPYMAIGFFPLYVIGGYLLYREKAGVVPILRSYAAPFFVVCLLWLVPMAAETGGIRDWLQVYSSHISETKETSDFGSITGTLMRFATEDFVLWKMWGPGIVSIFISGMSFVGLFMLIRSMGWNILLMCYVAFMLISHLLFHHPTHLRYTLPLAGAMVMGLAYLMHLLTGKRPVLFFGALGTVIAFWISFSMPAALVRAREFAPLERAVSDLIRSAGPRTSVFVEANETMPHMRYYGVSGKWGILEIAGMVKGVRASGSIWDRQTRNVTLGNLPEGSEAVLVTSGKTRLGGEDKVLGNPEIASFEWGHERVRWFLEYEGRYFSAHLARLNLIPGPGWFGLNRKGGTQFRWVEKESRVFFYRQERERAVFSIRFRARKGEGENALAMSVNGTPVYSEGFPNDGGRHSRDVLIPSSALREGWNELAMTVDKAGKQGKRQRRMRCIQVEKLRITPEGGGIFASLRPANRLLRHSGLDPESRSFLDAPGLTDCRGRLLGSGMTMCSY